MKDMPLFTTENGVASLTLKEIPYRQTAYIKLRDTRRPQALLEECRDFCRAVGAEHIYAAGHSFLETYPLHTAIWHMAADRESLPDTDAATFPVTEQILEDWRELYNRRMADVPNASYMTLADAQEMLLRGDGYFVHRNGALLGIGMAAGERVDAVISARPGAGRDVVLALNHTLSGDRMVLEVASANTRAIRLYEGLGFLKIAEISRWYKII